MIVEALAPNQVFVFGSNTVGDHSGGAARQAMQWGARMGQPRGPQGRTYAVPTVALSEGFLGWDRIREELLECAGWALKHPEDEFLLTPVGTGIAGGRMEDLDRIVEDISWPSNVVFTWRAERSVGGGTVYGNLSSEQRASKIAELESEIAELHLEIASLDGRLAEMRPLSVISERVRDRDRRLLAAQQLSELPMTMRHAFECVKTVCNGDELLTKQLHHVVRLIVKVKEETEKDYTLKELPESIRRRTEHLVVEESAVRALSAQRENLRLQVSALRAQIETIEKSAES